MHSTCMPTTHRSHIKKGSDPLELELWMFVNRHVGSGTKHSPLQERQVPLAAEPLLQPSHLSFESGSLAPPEAD